MKRILILMLIIGGMTAQAHAADSCVVRSCNAGYYAMYSIWNVDRPDTIYWTQCERCPELPKATGGYQYGTTPSSGLNSIEACTMPANVTFADSYGTYHFTSACKYTK